MTCLLIVALTLCAVLTPSASVDSCDGCLRFASYYGDHMVLQRSPERAVLWGYGPDGGHVTVSLSGPVNQKTSPVPVLEGVWQVTMDPVDAGGPYNVTAATEGSTATLTDVLFGDVWLCGGQSNMGFETYKIFNASDELALVPNYSQVRPFMVALEKSQTELMDLIEVKLPWTVPTAGNVADFSALCWLFGHYMHDILKYPIGLVESCWSGTPVEMWSSTRALQQCGLAQSTEEKAFPSVTDSVLWNSMIHPLLNMTIKGAIWYQGESNADLNQDEYNCSFPAMIDDWRMAFHQGSGGQTAADFPFGFVQLSTYLKTSTSDAFPNIRWHQTADVGFVPNPRMPRTFMAVALDLPDEFSPYHTIHPRYKRDIAYRLSLGARAVAYNETDVHFLGPFPNQTLCSGMHVNITYDQAVSVTPSSHVFEICCSANQAPCGPKSLWVPAPITNWGLTTVQLSTSLCSPTEEAAAVRYAWRDWPCDYKACPIYSLSGILPGPPFISNCHQGNN
ncbi:sialate O-acetylesterase [Hippoglossus hippoglossus]|uniref:sialate O-acetylesterase n=1 Tax=Hippoglossus hippoglossus TaxID=8267 RepID=UPI00148C49D1|nr:sialate O-acetylesterase [Hippoglossus hippoglossus]